MSAATSRLLGAPEAKDFAASEAPIEQVTVYKSRAEVTRRLRTELLVGNFDVSLVGLPSTVVEDSLRVEGTGSMTILQVSYTTDYSTELVGDDTTLERELKKLALQDELQQLQQKDLALKQARDRVANVMGLVGTYSQNMASASSDEDKPRPTTGLEAFEAVVSFVAKKSEEADEEYNRIDRERADLHKEILGLKERLNLLSHSPKTKGYIRKATVSLEVTDAHPLELVFRYVVTGAQWLPSYDLRVETGDNRVALTYYGTVQQTTGEDWNAASLTLSTAEPSISGTPPALRPQSVGYPKPLPPPAPMPYGGSYRSSAPKKKMSKAFGRSRAREEEEEGECDGELFAADMVMAGAPMMQSAMAPPPPPPAAVATAGVMGGGQSMGSIAYEIKRPSTVGCDGTPKRLTVGILNLQAEVTHYVVPSVTEAAYLRATLLNVTDYHILSSPDVSIFFGNSFVSRTNLRSVAPGESFDLFLGKDPACRVTRLPDRVTTGKKSILGFSKTTSIVYQHNTVLVNSKAVPMTIALVEALPRSRDEGVKVTLKVPKEEDVLEVQAGSDDTAVEMALERIKRLAPEGVARAFIKNKDTNTLVSALCLAEHQELQVPFEYAIDHPADKAIEFGS
jgi:uncharacterized protein (TIGR02231 family)